MRREPLIQQISGRLGQRKLIWVGTRCTDAAPLLAIPEFSEVYGLIAPLNSISTEVNHTLECHTLRRVDLDTYSIDKDHCAEAEQLREALLRSVESPAALMAYHALSLVSDLVFPRASYLAYLGFFHERQATFEYKPWVETELRKRGVRTVPWRYFTGRDIERLETALRDHGALVLRANRTAGGAGLSLAKCPADLVDSARASSDGFLAASRYLDPHIPLNINACVFRDGSVTLHHPSVQLIGIPELTRRTFGYCGNDFGAIRDVDPRLVKEFEEMTASVGAWMSSQGYLGAFGVDALIHDGTLYLTEVNPRFQGSSALSARIDQEIDQCDVYLCHAAALLGLEPPKRDDLSELLRDLPPRSQMICHNTSGASRRVVAPPKTLGSGIELLPEPAVQVEPDAIDFRVVIDSVVTSDGRSLDPGLLAALRARTPAGAPAGE